MEPVQLQRNRSSGWWNEQEAGGMAIKIDVNEMMAKNADCCICLEMYKEPTLTPCGHTFCAACIGEIINRTHTCPVCKRDNIQ